MAALSLASERKLDHLTEMAEQIAFDSGNHFTLRMAALNTSLNLEPNEDFPDKLQEIINDPQSHKLLKKAAVKTLETFKKIKG